MKRILQLISFSNIIIGIAIFALAELSFTQFNDEGNFAVSMFIGLMSFVTYNIQRWTGFDKTFIKQSKRHLWMFSNRHLILVLIIGSGISSLFLIKHLNLSDYVILAIAGIISISYSLSFQKIGLSFIRLRDLPGIKIYLIGFIWVLITVLLPYFHSENSISPFALIGICLERFLFIIAITIPFDIRDLKVDSKNLKTIPQVIGIKKSIRLSALLALLALGLSTILMLHKEINPIMYLSFMFSYFTTIPILYNSENKSELYYTGLIDALMILPYLIWIIISAWLT